MSRQEAFLRVVAIKAASLLDRLFGSSFWGLHSMALATVIVATTYLLGAEILLQLSYSEFGTERPHARSWAPTLLSLAAILVVLGSSFSNRLRRATYLIACVILAAIAYMWATLALLASLGSVHGRDLGLFANLPIAITGGLAIGIPLTLASATTIKRVATRVSRTGSEWPLLLIVAPPLLSATLFFWLMKLAGSTSQFRSASILLGPLVFAFGVSLAATGLAALMPAGAVLMLLHKLVWPLLSRILYAFPRHRVVSNKVLLNVTGFALIISACNPDAGWGLLLKAAGAG